MRDPHEVIRARWLFVAFIVCLSVFSWITEASELDMPDTFWPDGFQYYTHGCNSEVDQVIKDVAQEAASYSVPIDYAGVHEGFERDNYNTVGCAPSSPFNPALISGGVVYTDHRFVFGITRAWHVEQTGEIVEFDIWLNETWMYGDFALMTVRHEFGHALGLTHSEYGESLMAASNGPTEWDIETIAKLGLLYQRCKPHVDNDLNLWIPNLNVDDQDVYAVMPSGLEWPAGVFWYGDSRC